MQMTNGSITSQYGNGTREDFLFTYNEEEKQENEINKNNAGLLFKPKYIVFRPQLLEAGLSINEALVYSFIDGYLRDSCDKFYFTNEQIGKIFGFGEQNTSLIIKKLKDKGFIDTSYRLKANGGKIRFIKNLYSDYKNFYSPTIKKFIDNNNKINNNKINNISSSSVSNETSSEGIINSNSLNSNNVLGNNDYTAEFDIFRKIYPHARKGKKQDAKKYFMQQDIESVMENVKLYKWKIELGISDSKYVPACERWIRDFVPVNNVVKEQDLYKIVCEHMQRDGKKERYAELKNDFGEEKMDELVKKYNSNKKPTLYFN